MAITEIPLQQGIGTLGPRRLRGPYRLSARPENVVHCRRRRDPLAVRRPDTGDRLRLLEALTARRP
eukprot:5423322-Alexandrium_andersonii.AAC.1